MHSFWKPSFYEINEFICIDLIILLLNGYCKPNNHGILSLLTHCTIFIQFHIKLHEKNNKQLMLALDIQNRFFP